MIEIDPTRFKLPPWEHQLRGVKTLIKKDVYGLFWKMRLGKTKVVIDTACLLFEAGVIDTLLIVAPAQVKDVWIERNLGEIKTHDWSGAKAFEYKSHGSLALPHGKPAYVAASIEFLRQKGTRGDFPLVDDLIAALDGRRVWFVFDEASVLGNYKSLSNKAMMGLRQGMKRVTLLDGTPRGNSNMAYYGKFKVLDPKILDCKYARTYQNRYCIMGGFQHKEVVGEKNTEDFVKRTAPFCEYLEQDPADMPEKVPGVLTAALSEKAWKAYCSMRDELIAEIDQGVCAVGQAAVKTIRLAQMCAGYLGGVAQHAQMSMSGTWSGPIASEPVTVEVHDAPTKMLMGWLEQRFAERSDFKCVIWSRFVPEIERLSNELRKFTGHVGVLYGERKEGYQNFHPKHASTGPMVLVAQPQSAQYGLNFSKADTVVYLSQDYNRVTRAQSEDRVQAIGTGRKTTQLIDVLVTGPRGQKTIVHDIIRSVREKEEAEKRTAKDWIKALREE